MQILIIRHGDPDYEHDSLTERGRLQVRLLAERLRDVRIDKIYCSPMGRARETVAPTAETHGLEPQIMDFLAEIGIAVYDPRKRSQMCGWNLHPLTWTEFDGAYDKDKWLQSEPWSETDMPRRFEEIGRGMDGLLASHGFVRDGEVYRTEAVSGETIAIFCHQGLGTALIAHLLRMPLLQAWNVTAIQPSSVTRIALDGYNSTPGICMPRLLSLGDMAHLDNEEYRSYMRKLFAERNMHAPK